MEVGGIKSCFLDLKLTLKDNKIQTTVYSKPTNSYLYLQADFCPFTIYYDKRTRICFNIMSNLFNRREV